MAFYDRCVICDYTVHSGAGSIGVSAGVHGKVRRYGDEFLCDTCIQVISASLGDLYIGKVDGEVELEDTESSPTLPVL